MPFCSAPFATSRLKGLVNFFKKSYLHNRYKQRGFSDKERWK